MKIPGENVKELIKISKFNDKKKLWSRQIEKLVKRNCMFYLDLVPCRYNFTSVLLYLYDSGSIFKGNLAGNYLWWFAGTEDD